MVNKLALGQLIIDLYRTPSVAISLCDNDWVQIIKVLRHHQLLARYCYIFKLVDVFDKLTPYAKRHLINAEILASKQNNQVIHEARELTRVALGQSKRFVFLKGAGYSLCNDQASIGRTYNDIDLLVEKEAIQPIERRLNLNCWMSEKITEYDKRYYRKWAHEIPPLRNNARGTILDLHHNLVPVVSNRSPDIKVFFDEIATTETGEQVLSAPARTLHSIIHLFFNEDVHNGFRDLTDIDLLIKQHGSEAYWRKLNELAVQSGFDKELWLCKFTLKALLDTPLPDSECQSLGKPTSQGLSWLGKIYAKALMPNHPATNTKKQLIALNLVFLRGHFGKMPMYVLIYHSVHKLFTGLAKLMFGESVFEKTTNKLPPAR